MSQGVAPVTRPPSSALVPDVERRVLDAAQICIERWGHAKVTVDDIASEAKVSRATLYRLFPGGRDVLFEALRVRRIEEFFAEMRDVLDDTATLEDLLVRILVNATQQLRHDVHLATTLASEPGEVLSELTVAGLPRVVRMATVFLTPLLEPYLDRVQAARLVDLLARLVISFFLAPSDHVDLGDPESARRFLPFVLAGIHQSAIHSSDSESSQSSSIGS